MNECQKSHDDSIVNTLITPWSLLVVTSMPFAANRAVADW